MKDRVVVLDKQNGSLNVLPELDVFVSDVRLDIYKYILIINKLDGYDLPVSAFMDKLDGSMKSGVAIKEKRAIATELPRWNKDNCIQCTNQFFLRYFCVI